MFFAMREFKDSVSGRPFHRRVGRPMLNLESSEKVLSKGGHTGYVCEDRMSNIVSIVKDGTVYSGDDAVKHAVGM